DDEKKFDALMDEAEQLQSQIDRLAKLDAAARALEAADKPQERRSAPVDPTRQMRGRGTATVEDRSLALQGWLAASSVQSSVYVTDRHREAAARCGISLDQRQITVRLSPLALAGLTQREIADWEERTTQVGVVSPDLGGHYTV